VFEHGPVLVAHGPRRTAIGHRAPTTRQDHQGRRQIEGGGRRVHSALVADPGAKRNANGAGGIGRNGYQPLITVNNRGPTRRRPGARRPWRAPGLAKGAYADSDAATFLTLQAS
jgi:hypothetical protein